MGKPKKENKVVEADKKSVTEQAAEFHDKKTKIQEAKTAKTSTPKTKPKVEKQHYQMQLCQNFANTLAEELNLDLDTIHISRKQSYDAPRLSKNKRQLCWILPRFSGDLKFSVYLFVPNQSRAIIDVANETEYPNVLEQVSKVAEAINDRLVKIPKPKQKKNTVQKTRDIDSIVHQLDKMTKSTKAIKVPTGIMPGNKDFAKEIETRNLKVDWDNRTIVRA